MRQVIVVFASFFAVVISLALPVTGECPDSPEHFTFTPQTSSTYSIVITDVTFFRRALEPGDEIGVFDGDLCVGAVCWQNPPIALTAWADDPQTDPVDGYACERTMSFKIWSNSTGVYHRVHASYTDGNGEFCSGPYSVLSLAKPGGMRPRKILLGPSSGRKETVLPMGQDG